MPGWAEQAVCWHVFPLGFLGAEAEALPPGAAPTHRLRRLEPWLDYLIELGASALLLGPVFESSTHGYDTVDYRAIDRRLGDDADFDALISAAHARGIRVILDGVFNHVGREFPAFQQALRDEPGSASEHWFRLYWQADGAEPEYEHFEGHRQLVTLNHAEPAVIDFVVDVMCAWLDRGADGWRLDAAYAMPTEFWATVLPRVRERHPDAFIFGEVIHGDYPAIVEATGLDSVTQYELWKAVWSSLNDGNFHELAWCLQRHDQMLETFVPVTFLGNHDVTRIATRLASPQHLPLALVVLFTVGGLPCVYAGDEQGFVGTKEDRPGGDDAIRPAFPDRPEQLSVLGAPVLALHRELIALRRRHPWLHRARTRAHVVANTRMAYEASHDGHSLLVALNAADTPAVLDVPTHHRTVLAGHAGVEPLADVTRLRLAARGWAVLGR